MTVDATIVARAILLVPLDLGDCFPGLTPAEHRPFEVELDGAVLDGFHVVANSEDVVAVPWVYRCRHTDTFLGVYATFIDIELRGVSFVDARSDNEDEWVYYRYIDFLGALHQLGVSAVGRPTLDGEQYARWTELRR